MKVMTIAAAAGIVAIAGCGGSDSASEEAIENLIENAASQDGQDVDVEFDDDGNIQVSTDDGDFSIQTDDGVAVIETDEGTSTFTQGGGEVPEGFPAEIPLPPGLTVTLSQTADLGGGQTGISLVGTAPGDWRAYTDQLSAALEAAGYTQQQYTLLEGSSLISYMKGDVTVVAGANELGEPGMMSVTVQVARG